MSKITIALFIICILCSCSNNNNKWISNFGVHSNCYKMIIETNILNKGIVVDSVIIDEKNLRFISVDNENKCIYEQNKLYKVNLKNKVGRIIDFEKIAVNLINENNYDADFSIDEWQCLEQRNLVKRELSLEVNGKEKLVDMYNYNTRNSDEYKKGLISYIFCTSVIRMSDNLFGKYNSFYAAKLKS